MKLKLKNGYYRLRNVARFVCKIRILKIFYQQNSLTNKNNQWRYQFNNIAYRYCDGLYFKGEKNILYITANSPRLLTDAVTHSSPYFP